MRALPGAALALACLTNKPTAFARNLLRAKGLAAHFGHVIGGDAFERRKPDPRCRCRKPVRLGAEPRQTLMIGTRATMRRPRAAGCPIVLVSGL